MQIRKIDQIMVPLSEYATVNENDTLADAMKTLKDSHKTTSKDTYRHRAVLVYNDAGNITGKVGSLDVLRALEPKYSQFGQSDQLSKHGLSRFGFSNEFLKSLLERYSLLDESCETLVKKAAQLKVKKIMHSPLEGEYVNKNAKIAEAIHQLILGHHQSLLVLEDKKVIGILRLSDVFNFISDLMLE